MEAQTSIPFLYLYILNVRDCTCPIKCGLGKKVIVLESDLVEWMKKRSPLNKRGTE